MLRDENGGFLASACYLFPQLVDPEAAEIMACKQALLVAADINVRKLHVELDNQSLFLEMEEDPQPLHLDDACSHFINCSQKTLQSNTTVRLKPPSRQLLSLLPSN